MEGSNNVNQFNYGNGYNNDDDDGYNATINQRAAGYNPNGNKRKSDSETKWYNNTAFKILLGFLGTLVVQDIIFRLTFGQSMDLSSSIGIIFRGLMLELKELQSSELVGLGVFFVAILLFLFLSSGTVKKKRKTEDAYVYNGIYSELVPKVVSETFGQGSVFSHDYGMPEDEMLRLNCFKDRQINLRGRDYISGIYKGVSFSCGYEYMEHEYKVKDDEGDVHLVTGPMFKGIVIAVEFRKASSSPLGLFPNSIKDIEKNCKNENYKIDFDLNKTENENFNRMFTIRSTDEENLFYILSPEVMERITALYGKTYSYGAPYTRKLWECGEQGLNICFDEEKMYVAFNSSAAYMNYGFEGRNSDQLEKYRPAVINDMQAIEHLLDLVLEVID